MRWPGTATGRRRAGRPRQVWRGPLFREIIRNIWLQSGFYWVRRPERGELMECPTPRPGPDEEALVRAAQLDRTAFAPLYEMHAPRIYQYSLCRTGSAAEAEEVTAQTFLRALEYLDRYRWTGAPFVVWLYRIADSVMLKSRRRPAPGALPPDLVAPAVPGLEEEEQRLDLLRELYRLPTEHQRVLILRFAQRLSYEEIAAVTDRTPGALRQLVFRALQTMRERMGRQ